MDVDSVHSGVVKKNRKKVRRRRFVRMKRKETLTITHSVRKELEETKVHLAQTQAKMLQTRKRALELSKQFYKLPPPLRKRISSVCDHSWLRSHPTPLFLSQTSF